MNIARAERIFMLGIGGTGMRGLAWLLQAKGKTVRGTDSEITAELSEQFTIAPSSQAKEALASSDLMIYTDAAPADHPLLHHATTHAVPALPYHHAVSQLAQPYTTIAVTGTHGKSSTTAFLAHLLIEAGMDPTVLLGAAIPTWPGHHARLGHSQYLVVEADEYREHFLSLSPAHAIIASIDYDHPDYFSSLEAVVNAYDEFIQRLRPGGSLVIPDTLYAAHPELPWPSVTIRVPRPAAQSIRSPIPGKHMQQNAALAVRLAVQLGIEQPRAQAMLQTFPGLSRRLETVGTYQSLQLISDYAHHPAEIAATLEALSSTHPNKKIIVIFEAHMIIRLQTFFDQFAQALAAQKVVIIYPTYTPTGREEASAAALTQKLATRLQQQGTEAIVLQQRHQLGKELSAWASRADIAIALSAGQLDSQLRQLTTPSAAAPQD
jgi:UDP-N-acetylmuramate--alanine ligase